MLFLPIIFTQKSGYGWD